MILPEEAIQSIRQVVVWIIRQQWEALQSTGACERVTPAEIERVLSEQENTLAEHPVDQFESSLEIYPTQEEGVWLVDLDLWDTQGPSDLTLKLKVTRTSNSGFEILIGDLRVL